MALRISSIEDPGFGEDEVFDLVVEEEEEERVSVGDGLGLLTM